MDKTTIYLTPVLRKALKEAARLEKRSQAEVIRGALEEYLGRKSRPVLRSVGMGEDPDLAAKDSEAWLEAEWRRA